MVQHFQEERQPNLPEPEPNLPAARQTPLSDPEFSRALDHLVIACVDVVLIYQEQILLAKRNQYPRRDWWMIGGRMQVGESPLQAVIRKIDQETNLGRIASDRLQFMNTYSTFFTYRKQEPRHHGLHSLNLVYRLSLTAQEFSQIQLTPLEYETWKWVLFPELVYFLPKSGNLDQALREILNNCCQAPPSTSAEVASP